MSRIGEEAAERRRIRRELPGHPVPAHPETARAARHARRQEREALGIIARAERRDGAQLAAIFQLRPEGEEEPTPAPWRGWLAWALALALVAALLWALAAAGALGGPPPAPAPGDGWRQALAAIGGT